MSRNNNFALQVTYKILRIQRSFTLFHLGHKNWINDLVTVTFYLNLIALDKYIQRINQRWEAGTKNGLCTPMKLCLVSISSAAISDNLLNLKSASWKKKWKRNKIYYWVNSLTSELFNQGMMKMVLTISKQHHSWDSWCRIESFDDGKQCHN